MGIFRRGEAPDPIYKEIEQVQARLALADLYEQLDRMAPETDEAGYPILVGNGGATAASPFVGEAASPSRSLIPWRRSAVNESVQHLPDPPPRGRPRRGYVDGIPIGGTTPTNSGSSGSSGAPDRMTAMTQLQDVYFNCPWAATCVDAIARTITAGALKIEPVHLEPGETADEVARPPEIAKVQALLDYVNPYDDIRQLMRRVFTDMLIFGDAFVEVTWAYGEPVALWPLDCQTMAVIADEHGNVGRMIDGVLVGYTQTVSTSGKKINFEPHEVIHVRMDAPGGQLYGVSPTTKALVPIMTWMFAAGLVKETMRKGDPPRLHIDYPLPLPDAEVRKGGAQYEVRNLGWKNIGRPLETKGSTTVKELSQNKIEYWLKVMDEQRDTMLSTYGVPKRKAGVSVPGSLGGAGAESGEDKTFRVNTCGPTKELAFEKFTFALVYQAFGIKDWRITTDEIDWRDDLLIEQIRDLRVRNGSWTRDRYALDIGEPPTIGGDVPFLVDRKGVVLYSDLAALSKASVAQMQKGTELDALAVKTAAQPQLGTGEKPPPSEEENDDDPDNPLEGSLRRTWAKEWAERRRAVFAELSSGR